MLIGITGHTKGLGMELCQYLYHHSKHQVLGFSKENGYNLSKENMRNKLLRACNRATVFINLSNVYYHQTDLLLAFWNDWKNKDRLIINVTQDMPGGNLIDYLQKKHFNTLFSTDEKERELPDEDNILDLQFMVQKHALDSMSEFLAQKNAKVQICNYTLSKENYSNDVENLNKIIDDFQKTKS